MTGHGFRGLASTILSESGFEEAHIELQLAHTKRNKVAAAYNHAKYLKQRTTMMQWWVDFLDSQLAKANHRQTDAALQTRVRRILKRSAGLTRPAKQLTEMPAHALEPTA